MITISPDIIVLILLTIKRDDYKAKPSTHKKLLYLSFVLLLT